MKIDFVIFENTVRDPVSGTGESSFHIDNGYVIHLDESSGIVSVSKGDKTKLVHVSRCKELTATTEAAVQKKPSK